jgi:hypothetical protein
MCSAEAVIEMRHVGTKKGRVSVGETEEGKYATHDDSDDYIAKPKTRKDGCKYPVQRRERALNLDEVDLDEECG